MMKYYQFMLLKVVRGVGMIKDEEIQQFVDKNYKVEDMQDEIRDTLDNAEIIDAVDTHVKSHKIVGNSLRGIFLQLNAENIVPSRKLFISKQKTDDEQCV